MKLIIYFLLLFLTTDTYCQRVDVAPRGKEGYRSTEGYSFPVQLDTSTPLDSLIKKLEEPWRLVETGKAYWIGYTDNMYSIAAHKSSAIEPLVAFYHSTKNAKSKAGAILTLHLIGIESTIIGRFKEKFRNTAARKALLDLTSDTPNLSLIIELLARDPWKSDLPFLVDMLKKHNNLELINALFRYTEKCFPFRDEIRADRDTLEVYIKTIDGVSKAGKLSVFYNEKKWDKEKYDKTENKIVQWIPFESARVFWQFELDEDNFRAVSEFFPCDIDSYKAGSCGQFNDLIYNLFRLSDEKVSVFSYCDLQDRFHHYIDGNKMIICTSDITRLRWLAFFNKEQL